MASFSIPSFVKGALWGVIVWAVAIVGAFSFGPVMRSYLGNDGRLNVSEAIGVLCTWVAFPIHCRLLHNFSRKLSRMVERPGPQHCIRTIGPRSNWRSCWTFTHTPPSLPAGMSLAESLLHTRCQCPWPSANVAAKHQPRLGHCPRLRCEKAFGQRIDRKRCRTPTATETCKSRLLASRSRSRRRRLRRR